jgi:hypothetical protein
MLASDMIGLMLKEREELPPDMHEALEGLVAQLADVMQQARRLP